MPQLDPPGIGVISSIKYTGTDLQRNFERAVRNAGQASWLIAGAIHENKGYDIDGALKTAVQNLNGKSDVGVIVTVGGLVAAIAAKKYANKPFLSLIGGTVPEFPGTIADKFYGGINLHTFNDNDARFTDLTRPPLNYSPSEICLLSNPNSAMAYEETKPSSWPIPPRGEILTATDDAEIRAAFTRFKNNASLKAMIISADPLFQDHKEVVIQAANLTNKYVCYPLQVFANDGGTNRPHPDRHRKHGPKLATEYFNLGEKTVSVIQSGAPSTLTPATSMALTGTGGKSLLPDWKTRESKEQVELIRTAIQNSLTGLLGALFKKENYVDVKLFPNGVDLIEVQATIGLPNTPAVEFKLKIAGPGPHEDRATATE